MLLSGGHEPDLEREVEARRASPPRLPPEIVQRGGPPLAFWVLMAGAAVAVLGVGWALLAFGPGSDAMGGLPVNSALVHQPRFGSEVERGAYLYHRRGCARCHGEDGRGARGHEAADLAPLATRLGLYAAQDAEDVVRMVEEGRDPTALRYNPPWPEYTPFVSQWDAVRIALNNSTTLVAKGRRSCGADIDTAETNAVLVYLITLHDWEPAEVAGGPLEHAQSGRRSHTAIDEGGTPAHRPFVAGDERVNDGEAAQEPSGAHTPIAPPAENELNPG